MVDEISLTIRNETNGTSIIVDIEPEATIGDLRNSLIKAGFMNQSASIYFGTRELDDKLTLTKVGIKNADTLQVGGAADAGKRTPKWSK